MSDIEVIKNEIEAQIKVAQDAKMLDDVRVSALGKKGRVTELLKTLGAMPLEERVEFGKKINVIKAELEQQIADKKNRQIHTMHFYIHIQYMFYHWALYKIHI